MIRGAAQQAIQTARVQREEAAVIAVRDDTTGAYTVTWRGVDVAPVWSLSGVRYEVGQRVRVLVEGRHVKGILP